MSSTITTAKSAAFTRGYDAAEFGDSEDDNPFDSYLEETAHAEWVDGLRNGYTDRSLDMMDCEIDPFIAYEDYEDEWVAEYELFG